MTKVPSMWRINPQSGLCLLDDRTLADIGARRDGPLVQFEQEPNIVRKAPRKGFFDMLVQAMAFPGTVAQA